MVPPHHARGAVPFGRAGDIDGFHAIEERDQQFLADLEIAGGSAEFADESLRLAIGFNDCGSPGGAATALTLAVEFGDVPALGAAGKATGLIEKTHLDCFVPIAFHSPELQDVARSRLNDGHRDGIPRRVVDLRHPDLAAE
jgi:hypothetical protein